MSAPATTPIEVLYRERSRSRLLPASLGLLALLAAYAWTSDVVDLSVLGTERAQRNVDRFLDEIRPYPLQGRAWDGELAFGWLREKTEGRALTALADTLALSLAAVVLAGLLALLASLLAARNLASADPFLPGPSRASPLLRVGFTGVVAATRAALIVLRSIPEYVLAFLLLVLLGPGAWPAVLALALHNAGILGKLFAEVTEDADPRSARALRALGASRLAIASTALWPDSLGRFLLFFFYRWETCVREATVLGLLGFTGVGLYVLQAQAAVRWDEMLLWTLLGSALVLAGDFASAWVRSRLRHAP